MANQVGVRLTGIVGLAFLLNLILCSTSAHAQVAAPAGTLVVAEIVGEFPYVYAQPDFDSPMLQTLKPGTFYNVSKQQYAYGFHRIMLAGNKVAFISSSEFKLVSSQYAQKKRALQANPKLAADQQAKQNEERKQREVNSRPMYISRYQGLIVEMQNFTEDTMSKTHNELLTFFGYRSVGYNTLFSGEMSTDTSVIVHTGAPDYYKDITGNAAAGWVVNAHFTFDTVSPISHDGVFSYGFGPMFKYSHFETYLKNVNGPGTTAYTLDDMTLGVLFRVGAGARWNAISLRGDLKYYIESSRYASVNVSTLYAF